MKHPLDKIMDKDKDSVQERIERNREATNSLYSTDETDSDPIKKRLERNRKERHE